MSPFAFLWFFINSIREWWMDEEKNDKDDVTSPSQSVVVQGVSRGVTALPLSLPLLAKDWASLLT